MRELILIKLLWVLACLQIVGQNNALLNSDINLDSLMVSFHDELIECTREISYTVSLSEAKLLTRQVFKKTQETIEAVNREYRLGSKYMDTSGYGDVYTSDFILLIDELRRQKLRQPDYYKDLTRVFKLVKRMRKSTNMTRLLRLNYKVEKVTWKLDLLIDRDADLSYDLAV